MADQKVSQLAELAAGDLDPAADFLLVSDMSASASKRMKASEMIRASLPYISTFWDFTKGPLLPTVSFTRASTGWRTNSSGVLVPETTDVARFEYDPVTLAPRGLLIEAAATNGIRNSTMQGAVAGTPGTLPTNWSFNSTGGLTQSVVGVGTINGIPYIDYRYQGTSTDAGGSNQYLETTTQIVAALSQNWTVSAYVALVAGSLSGGVTMKLGAVQRTSAGGAAAGGGGSSNLDGSAFSPTATLTRYSAPVSLNSSDAAYIQPKFSFVYTSGAAIDFTLRIGLPQMVQASMVSSPIPTAGTAASRAADVVLITNPQALADQCYIVKARTPVLSSSTANIVFQVDDGTFNNRRAIYYFNGRLYAAALVAGVAQATLDLGAVANDTDFVIAARFADNNFAASLNGGAIVTDTSGANPLGLTTARIGAVGSSNPWNSTIRTLETRRTATDAELPLLAA